MQQGCSDQIEWVEAGQETTSTSHKVKTTHLNLSLYCSTHFRKQEYGWTLVLRNGKNPDITINMRFERLAVILEAFAKKRKFSNKLSDHKELAQWTTELSKSEREIIKNQVLQLRIAAAGGVYVLDPAISITKTSLAPVIPKLKVPRSLSCTGKLQTDNLLWLKEQKGPVVLRDIKHRHQFNRDLHFGGLLSSSEFACVHLMEAWPAELQSKTWDAHAKIEEEDRIEDCQLVCVKMATCAEGHSRLRREASALQRLQSTGRVAQIWNSDELSKYLGRGILITLYQPVPPPQDSRLDVFMSLNELEDRIEELSHALALLHKSGWIWLGLKPGHLLYTHCRIDPRDTVQPLRIIGLENSLCLSDKNSSENSSDPTWAAPEVKTQQPTRSLKAKGQVGHVSEGEDYILEAGPTTAADLFSLGLLISAHLARTSHPVMASDQNLCSLFNSLVYDTEQQIYEEHWLVRLRGELLQTNPLLRPTAEQVLQHISLFRRQPNLLQMLEPGTEIIDGYIHPDTHHMIWPVVLKTIIVKDQRNAARLTDYVTVHAGLDTPRGKALADYKGRSVTKQYLIWLRHLGLHTHALNDGDCGAYDGRRKCNGIFDMPFYKTHRQVTITLVLLIHNNISYCYLLELKKCTNLLCCHPVSSCMCRLDPWLTVLMKKEAEMLLTNILTLHPQQSLGTLQLPGQLWCSPLGI
jgi:serine/threonine protein kinase